MYTIITIYGRVKTFVMTLFIFWIIFFIRFGTKLYRQTIYIPVGTNCAPLVVDLFLFCYERDFMKSLSRENQADIIEAFNSTSRYLDDLLNIDNIYFDQMMDRIYPTELQLNKANSSNTEVTFLDLNLCISNGTVYTKIYDKRDDFDFDIVNFPFLDGDIPRRTSYGVHISQLIRFARASSKKVREKSRECHNHKPQPFPDPKRKRKPTNLNKQKPNKRTKSTKISSLFPKRGNRNTKRTEKHKNKITHGKTYNKSPSRINHKATRSKTNKNLSGFNCRNKALTAKLLRQGYRYFKLRKAFSKFYLRHSALIEKYSVSLKTLLQKGISEPEFYSDLVYRFRKKYNKI